MNIPCVVKSVVAGEYCTLTVETVEKMPGNGTTSTLAALNAAQVESTEPTAAPHPPPSVGPQGQALLDRIPNDFGYHRPPDDDTKQRHGAVRNILSRAAAAIVAITPPGRELSLTLTKLEEAMFWANGAIARQHPVTPD